MLLLCKGATTISYQADSILGDETMKYAHKATFQPSTIFFLLAAIGDCAKQ
jgi:hypothetical protein